MRDRTPPADEAPYAGAFELLADLKPHFRLACLSNTNELDVARFRDELRLHERFDACFFSNEIGSRKPAAECYEFVVRSLGMEPSKIAWRMEPIFILSLSV